ncbi:MAG: capsid cement protein [Chitinophagaceae bacterium]
MSGPGYIFNRPFTPGGAITQFRLVKFSATDTVVQCTAAADNPIGIAQETISAQDVTDGRQVSVALFGAARAIAGAAITAGAVLMNDTSGRVITATSTNFAVGRAIQAASNAGDHLDIILNPAGVVI